MSPEKGSLLQRLSRDRVWLPTTPNLSAMELRRTGLSDRIELILPSRAMAVPSGPVMGVEWSLIGVATLPASNLISVSRVWGEPFLAGGDMSLV